MNIHHMFTPIIDEESGEIIEEILSSATLSDDSTRTNDRNEAYWALDLVYWLEVL